MYHTAPCGKIISSTPETRYFLLTWSDGVHLTSIFQEHPAQIAMATWIIILPLARLPATMGSTSLTVLTYHSSSSAKCAAATLYYKPAYKTCTVQHKLLFSTYVKISHQYLAGVRKYNNLYSSEHPAWRAMTTWIFQSIPSLAPSQVCTVPCFSPELKIARE